MKHIMETQIDCLNKILQGLDKEPELELENEEEEKELLAFLVKEMNMSESEFKDAARSIYKTHYLIKEIRSLISSRI